MTESERLKKATAAKKPYAPPRLVDYGNLSQLTRGGSFVGNDGNTKCTGNAGPNDQCAPLS